jgi:hypothetical protein
LINSTGTGNFTFGGTNASAYYFPEGLSNPYTQAMSGSVILTSITPYLEGTFSFTTTVGTTVKSGSFSVLAP